MSETKTTSRRSTAASKAAASAESASVVDERLALAAALNNVAKSGDAWVAALATFQKVQEDLKGGIENALVAKKREREEFEAEFEQHKRAKKIKIEQDLAEFGYEEAKKILQLRGEVPILATELQALRARIQELETKDKTELKNALDEAKRSSDQSLAYAKRELTLQHEKEAAQLKAQAESLEKQLVAARAEVAKVEQTAKETRDLCRNIAEASSKAQIVQNLGGK